MSQGPRAPRSLHVRLPHDARARRAARWLGGFALGVSLALAAPHVHAQAPAGAGGLATPGAAIDVATPEQKQEAQGHYDKGVTAFEAGDHATALGAFEASYGVVRSPNAHLMLARALIGLERWTRAHDELLAVEQEAAGQEKYLPALEKARELRADVARRLSFASFVVRGVSGAYELRVRGALVDPGATLTTLPGAATVEVIEGGAVRLRKDVDLGPGQTQQIELDVPPPAPAAPVAPEPRDDEGGGLGATFWIGAAVTGVGVAGFGLATAFGLSAKSSRDDLDALCPGGACAAADAAQVDALKSDGEQAQTIHLVGLGVGVAGVAGGVTLMILGATGGGEPEVEVGAVRVRPLVGPGFLALDGSF